MELKHSSKESTATLVLSLYLDANLVRFDLDFTSVEYLSLSDAISFTYGTAAHQFTVLKTGAGALTFSPVVGQRETCMWDLNRCSAGQDRTLICSIGKMFLLELTLTFVLSIERFNRSILLFTQDLRRGAALHVNYLVSNDSSASLQFDLWLPRNRGLLRTQLTEFPYETPLFINVVFRSPSSLAVFLFGQLTNSTTKVVPIPAPKSSSLSFTTFVGFRSIAWSYDQTLSGRCCPRLLSSLMRSSPSLDCCAFERSKRDLVDLEACQCKWHQTHVVAS